MAGRQAWGACDRGASIAPDGSTTGLPAPASNRCEERIKKPSGTSHAGFEIAGAVSTLARKGRTDCGLDALPRKKFRDLADLSRLLATRDVDLRAIMKAPRSPFPRYHLLVLDVDGAVRAAVHVVISAEPELRGRLQLLVVDPGLTRTFGRAAEDRLAGVAVALCEAYGCAEIDIAATPQNDVAAARQVRAACVGS